jgi:hypothetical protein
MTVLWKVVAVVHCATLIILMSTLKKQGLSSNLTLCRTKPEGWLCNPVDAEIDGLNQHSTTFLPTEVLMNTLESLLPPICKVLWRLWKYGLDADIDTLEWIHHLYGINLGGNIWICRWDNSSLGPRTRWTSRKWVSRWGG